MKVTPKELHLRSAQKSGKFVEERSKLPIWKHKEILINTIKDNNHCIVVSSTGSGKTTQLPQFIYESRLLSGGMVAITQPRRVAAISVAQRVAEELDQGPVGLGPVGYCVRFEDCSDPRLTRLRYMTDGMLLREAALDPLLSRYDFVILDEAHERSLNTDVLFGVVLRAAQKRAQLRTAWLQQSRGANTFLSISHPSAEKKPPNPFKIIVMSATIDPAPFVNFLGPEQTRVIYIEGRPHPIRILNISDPSTDYVADAATACIQIHRSRACPPDRGILIFLTGEDEIVRCCALINQLSRLRRVDNTTPNDSSDVLVNNSRNSESCAIRVFSLFASLPQNKQLTALSFAQPNCRKVIVSTNLAETSITIPGIRYVIDCGYAKVRYWDTQSGLESFRIQRISKSQAWQRAGRAGREAAGVCLRLYTDAEYKKMALHPQPELVRAPMAGVLLNLIAMNVKCPLQFPWLTSPKAASVEASLLLLQRLDAVEQDTASTGGAEEATNKPYLNGNHELLKSWPRHSLSASDVQLTKPLRLTQLGSLMSAFPLDPRFSRVLVSSAHLGCFVEILSILSMLYVSPVFYVPTEKREEFSEIRQRFYHPDGDLISLLLVYRAYVKSSRVNDPKYSRVEAPVSRTESNQFWCRAHFLNRGRLNTAVKVRAQLKQIARGCGLTGFRSCGANLNLVAQAFLQSGFRDQVALLADPALLSSSGTQVVQELGQSRRSVYTLVGLTQSVADRFFIIHPESQLYPASLSDAPPAALLFIETVTQSVMGNEKLTEEKVDSHALTYMRHVSTIQWGSQLESNDRSEFFNWLTNLVTVTKNNPVNRQKRSDFSSSFADGKRVKRRCLLHSYFAAPTTPTNTDADHSTTSFNHICETTPSNTDADHLTASFNHVNETLPTVSQTGLSKKKLKRLAARRKRKRLLAATMHS